VLKLCDKRCHKRSLGMIDEVVKSPMALESEPEYLLLYVHVKSIELL